MKLSNEYNKPELLSPAGNMECLEAALSAGCDAVYAGLDRFGARAFAGNFTSDQFAAAMDRMHVFGKKLYLTLNTLIKQDEYDEVYKLIKPLYENGLDGVIVQDLGVTALLIKEFDDLKIHASTQMSVSSLYGAKLLMDLGISRIVTSRELSLEEIKSIVSEGAELECFIHGAMCYSYSGMCLMSSFLGGRSGNRGRCAGPCRQPYSAGRMKNRYLLSMKDLCTVDILDDLIDAGIASFKIEGRMKSPAYVYGVTDIYRRSIDRICENPGEEWHPSPEDRKRLVELYSRGGISDGYYYLRNGLSLITVDKGAYKREDKAGIKTERKRYELKAELRAYTGEQLSLRLYAKDAPEKGITVTGDEVMKAENHPVTEEELYRHLNKTGGSDFIFISVDIDTDGNSFVRVSSINELRRKALAMVKDKLTDGYKRSL